MNLQSSLSRRKKKNLKKVKMISSFKMTFKTWFNDIILAHGRWSSNAHLLPKHARSIQMTACNKIASSLFPSPSITKPLKHDRAKFQDPPLKSPDKKGFSEKEREKTREIGIFLLSQSVFLVSFDDSKKRR